MACNMKNKKSIIDVIQCVLLALSPILHMYRFISIITVGELTLLICVLISIFTCKNLLLDYFARVFILLTYFFAITFLGTIVFKSDAFNSFKEYLAFFIYYLFAFYLVNKVNIQMFLYYYEKIALICALCVIVQFVAYTFFNIHISGLIPNATTYFGNSTNFYIAKESNRCAGFFTEPAMCARYLGIPFLAGIAKTKRMLSINNMLFSLAILFTLTGNGIITLIIGYALLIILLFKDKKMVSIGRMLLTIFTIVILVISLYHIALFKAFFGRIGEITGNSTFHSGYIRIVRGFVAYLNLPIENKIFGIGFGNYDNVMNLYFYDSITEKVNMINSWLNGIQTYLVFGGAVGVILFLYLTMPRFFRGNRIQKSVFILLFAYLFVAGIFNDPLWLIFIVIIFSSFDKGGLRNGVSNYTDS